MPVSNIITEEWLTRTLADLGDTADEVAATLRGAEIKGRRSNAVQCPIARYLARRVAEHLPSTQATVNVHSDAAEITPIRPATHADTDADAEDPIVLVELPNPVLAFLQNFDEAAYPDLIDDST
jgi:hypothetical protein